MVVFDEKIIALFFLGQVPRKGVDWLCAIREIAPEKQ
jgi:hypothetical protein